MIKAFLIFFWTVIVMNNTLSLDKKLPERRENDTSQIAYIYSFEKLLPLSWSLNIVAESTENSRMTVERLYSEWDMMNNINNIFFMNSLCWNENEYFYHSKVPQREPLYLDWNLWRKQMDDENFWIASIEGNVLLTWYLTTNLVKYCPWESLDTCTNPAVEVWEISNGKIWITLGYTHNDLLLTDFPYKRFDFIDSTNDTKGVDLRKIANDGKIHTFHVILDDGWRQEWSPNWSMIREWWLIE